MTDETREVIRTELLAAVGDLIDAQQMTDDERTEAQTDLDALKDAVRKVVHRPPAPDDPAAPVTLDPLDDPATLAAVRNQDDPVGWLLAKLPPTDADALRSVLRVAGENGEADPGDHTAATREVARMARAARAAERDALLAVATGEHLDTRVSLAKPLNDARARIRATDAAHKQVDRARPGQARRAVPVTGIEGQRPAPLLSIADHGGALLSVGACWCWPARVALRKRRLPCRWRLARRRNGCPMASCTADCSPAPAARC